VRIAFQTYSGELWQAGVTFLTSLLQGLRALGDDAPELALVIWEGTAEERYQTVLPLVDRTISAPLAPPPEGELAYLASLSTHAAWWLKRRLLGAKPNGQRRFWSDALQKQAVDCAFSMPLERRTDFGVPFVVWLPDLQHQHLPDMFSPEERAKRDRYYLREIEAATVVLVTAEAVRLDIERFAPSQAAKVRVLRPVVPVPAAVYDQDPGSLAGVYHLPAKFFLLPNQYWAHKNHGAVLEALCRLRDRSVYPRVVCAGHPQDHRHPLFFGELLNRIAAWNLREQVVVLGPLPHEQVLRLMRQAVCVLNPSLFEGYGFSLAESISLGKRALVSDLPAHREQDGPEAQYFDPRDPGDLADKMEHIWQTAQSGPDLAREAAARAALPGRQREFGRACLELAREAVALGAARRPSG
jgi:glycosyltransferase involved in cell wall biosynthesis